MKGKTFGVFLVTLIVFTFYGCPSKSSSPPVELYHYPLDSLEGILSKTDVSLDKEVSKDGMGSLRIDAKGPQTYRLFEVEGVDVEEARIIYQAKLRSVDLKGEAYLEMWCVFTGQGEYFSRDVQHPITGTTEWITAQTPFFLQKGQSPERLRLNLVVTGAGQVWIDDIRIIKGPLK